ncbi:MAG: hypothetical protein KIS92_25860 [Planctomycetota bacterium]|nr:hypothetical protein [Planctomycetota bacterium]
MKKTKAAAPARPAAAAAVKKAPAEPEAAAPDRNTMKKHSKSAAAVAEPPVEPKPMPAAPLSRSALIKLRHEMMKKEIDQIREDLEAEENDE